MSAVSGSAVSRNSSASGSPNANARVRKSDKFEKRAERTQEKRELLLEGYKKLLRALKILEKYYQSGEQQRFVLGDKLQKKLLSESKAAFKRIPNVSDMKENEITELIEKQKKKVIDGVIIGMNKELKTLLDRVKENTKKREKLNGKEKQYIEIKINQNKKNYQKRLINLSEKYKNSQQIINAKIAMERYMKEMVLPKKAGLSKYEKITKAYQSANTKRTEAAKKAASARKKATEARREQKKAESNLQKKERQIEREAIKKAREQEKANLQAEKKRLKNIEKQKRLEAAQAEKENKEAKARERAAKARVEKEAKNARKIVREALKAAKQAKINAEEKILKTVPMHLTSTQLKNLY
jgi:hypothetical protein